MSRMSLDTAIRLSAEVKGGANITKVQRSLQDLAKGSQATARDMDTLRSATFQFARANDSTIAGLRNSITAFRGLQEQAKIGSREFTRYGAEVQRLEGKLKGLDGTAQTAGTSLGRNLAAGLAAAGIGRALQGITVQAGKFDAEVRKAAAIEGGAGSFSVLQKEIEKVAAAAAGTPTEVAMLASSLSRAGFSAKETTEALAGIVRGAEATSVTFEEMGSIAADNLRAFGLQTNETARVVDVLTQTANKSNQGVLDLGESMKYAAPIARSLGVPLEDLAAVMGLLANNGIRGSDAGTALRTGLTRLQIAAGGADSEIADLTRGNVQLTKAMSTLGSEILDTNGKLRPLDQVLNGLKKSLSTLSATDQAILTKALFGTEAGSKFQALLNSTEGQVKQMFAEIRNSGGVAEETQKKMQGFEYSVKVLGGNFEYLTNQIGGMIGMALQPLIDGLNVAIGAAQKLPEPVKAIGAAAAAAGVVTLGLVVAVGALQMGLAALGGTTAVLGALSAGFAGVGVAAAAAWAAITGPIGLTVLAIAGVTAAAYAMSPPFREFLDDIPGRFKTFWSELGSDANDIVQRITGLAKGIGSEINRIAQTAQGAVQDVIAKVAFLGPAMQSITQGIGSIFSDAFSFIENRWQQTVANMVNGTNPLYGILKLAGVDIGSATASAMSYQTGAKRIEAAGSKTTYTVGGITYDTATGAPLKPPPAFVPGMGAPSPPLSGAGAAAGGGTAAGAGASTAKAKPESIGAQVAKALAQALDLTPAQAAGAVGALLRESPGLNPRLNEGGAVGPPRGVGGYGTAQWTGPRQQDLVRFAGGAAGAGNLQTQLRFMVSELMGPESKALASLRKATTPEDAAVAFDRDYLRSGVKALPERKANARRVYSEISGGGAGAGLDDFAGQLKSQAQAAEAMQQQQQAAKDLLATESNRLKLLQIADPMQRQVAESMVKQLTIEDEYNKRIEQTKKTSGDESMQRQTLATLQSARQNALQANGLELERSIADIREDGLKPLNDAVTEYRNRLAYEREYGGLLQKGINPELAKQFIEIDRIAAASKTSLELQIAKLDVLAAELPIGDKIREGLEKQIKLSREALGLVPPAVAEAKGDAKKTNDAEAKRLQQEEEAKTSAERIKDLYKGIAGTIRDGIVDAMQAGIDSLIDGSKRLDESLKEIASGVLKEISNALLRFAINTAAKSLFPKLFADGGVFNGGEVTAFANGGIVNEPTLFKFANGGTMRNGLLGEAGPEAIMPLRRGADGRLGVDASGMAVPYQASPAAGAAGESATPYQSAATAATAGDLAVPFRGSPASGTSGDLAVPFQSSGPALAVPFLKAGGGISGDGTQASIDVKFETVQIGNMDVVTREEAQRIGHEAAQRGAELAQKRLRNSPSARRAAGIS